MASKSGFCPGKLKRLPVWMLLAAVCLLSGCMLWRLLQLRGQLRDFDKYCWVDDQHGLALHFKVPVLYDADFRELLKTEPTSIVTNQDRQTWLWTFEKQFSATNTKATNFDMTFATGFKAAKFDELDIPQRALLIVPEPIVLGFIKALGGAEINPTNKSVAVDIKEGDIKGAIKPLTKSMVTQLMGEPFSMSETTTNYTYFYKYNLRTTSKVPLKAKLVMARFTFATDDDRLTFVHGFFAGVDFGFSFAHPAGKEANQPASPVP